MTDTQTYRRHNLSLAFGEATGSDYAALKDSIRRRGFDRRHPIVIYDDGEAGIAVLDGRHRLRACEELGVELMADMFEEFQGTKKEAVEFVFSENMARRQMSQQQKVTAYQVRNQHLDVAEQLSDSDIAEVCGYTDRQKIAQIGRLVEEDIDVAQRVAAGELPTDEAIRDTLHEEPVDRRETEEAGVFTIKNKRRLKRFADARRAKGWTVVKATNKALDLFIEWAKESK